MRLALLAVFLAMPVMPVWADCVRGTLNDVEGSSAESARENGAANNADDGNLATAWITRWSTDPDNNIHYLTLTLADESDVCGLRVFARADGAGGTIADYTVWVWVFDDAIGIWKWDGVTQGAQLFDAWTPNAERTLNWPARRTTRIRIGSHRDVNGGQFASAAEVEVLVETPPDDAPEAPAKASTWISWGEVPTATTYRVEQSRAGGPWLPLALTPGIVPCRDTHVDSCGTNSPDDVCWGVTITDLDVGVNYSWRTIASNSAGDSPPSCVISWTPTAPPAEVLPPLAPESIERGEGSISWCTGRWYDLAACRVAVLGAIQ